MINIKDNRFLEVLPDRSYVFIANDGTYEVTDSKEDENKLKEAFWATRMLLCIGCSENHIFKLADQASAILEDFGWCNDCEKAERENWATYKQETAKELAELQLKSANDLTIHEEIN